jgi:hypothetical protein
MENNNIIPTDVQEVLQRETCCTMIKLNRKLSMCWFGDHVGWVTS